MAKDRRDLLRVLQAELKFIEDGGYRHTARAQWRPQFIFQDSPSCLNFDPSKPPQPCLDCVLMQLVPLSSKLEAVPCRFIPLNERGDTLDSFYRCGSQEELEKAVSQWLREEIARLEAERAAEPEVPQVRVQAHFTTPHE